MFKNSGRAIRIGHMFTSKIGARQIIRNLQRHRHRAEHMADNADRTRPRRSAKQIHGQNNEYRHANQTGQKHLCACISQAHVQQHHAAHHNAVKDQKCFAKSLPLLFPAGNFQHLGTVIDLFGCALAKLSKGLALIRCSSVRGNFCSQHPRQPLGRQRFICGHLGKLFLGIGQAQILLGYTPPPARQHVTALLGIFQHECDLVQRKFGTAQLGHHRQLAQVVIREHQVFPAAIPILFGMHKSALTI